MRARTSLWLLGVFSLVLCAGFVQCRVDDTIDNRLWPCDPDHPECGRLDGKDMECWQGYCMPACDPHAPAPANHRCLDVGVLVQRCSPSAAEDECERGLSCFRTDLLLNDGICVPFRVCSRDEDCPDELENACASTVLKSFYLGDAGVESDGGGGEGGGASLGPRFDHLRCVQNECLRSSSGCGNGAFCLPKEYGNSSAYPDICVPRCDSEERCPPDYACGNNPVSPGATKLCIPGGPGVRCTDEQNCAAGHCLDIGVSFDICTTECANDKECEPYTKPPHYFRCLEATADGGKRCINTTSLTGFKCLSAADCPADTPLCTSFSPAGSTQPNAECRPLCHADGSCDSRAGVPHVCLDDIAMRMRGVPGGCYPGTFGLPCEHSSECLRPSICHEITPDGFEFLPATKICTQLCESDEDCRPDPDYPKNPDRPFIGYCGPDGFCRVPLHGGTSCAEGKQCYSGTCNPDPSNPNGPLGICGADP